ncbi:serine hydrolase [Kitasatospora sp. NPDC101157]|uniref:serine hydrolase n=1 Tax=Kitasatospora sp. NPDC101157 TaxID=3364098 RepID=UPI003826B7D0
MYQPGERWLYNVSYDVLGVLVARVTGRSCEAFLRERIFDPPGQRSVWRPVAAARRGRSTSGRAVSRPPNARPPRTSAATAPPPRSTRR